MVSSKKKLVWFYELPTVIPELMKEGFNEFHFSAMSEKKRILLRAWRQIDRNKRWECLGNATEDCGLRYIGEQARSLHWRATGHDQGRTLPLPRTSKKEEAAAAVAVLPEAEVAG